MKKAIGIGMALMMVLSLAVGCAAPAPGSPKSGLEGEISVNSREDGSGTRGAFVELFEVEQKDDAGNKVDMTTLEANITNSTSVMLSSVAGDEAAIGYISLGSLNDTVKALMIDGAAPTVENIKSGSYGISRPFNVAYKADLSEPAKDFLDFVMSADGQQVAEDSGYIRAEDAPAAYDGGMNEGKIVIAGSSSITPVMEKLKEAYQAVNPGVQIEIHQSDSSTGMNSAIEGICDIGMASRAVKDSELAGGLTPLVIAMDGIAVIVNNANPMTGLTKEQVRDIYIGDVLNWSELG